MVAKEPKAEFFRFPGVTYLPICVDQYHLFPAGETMLIRLELVRELHPHFPKDISELTNDHTHESSATKWHLLGSNDYLLVTKVDSLPELGDLYGGRSSRDITVSAATTTGNSKRKTKTTSKPRAGGVQEWILCQPFIGFQEEINAAYATLTSESSGPVLMIAASFSSAYFDQLDYKQIVSATKEMMGKVRDVANSYQDIKKFHVLTSLGGMDLAILIDVGKQGLNKSFELLNQLRELRNSVANGNFHHYFSQVNAFFCFRTKQDLSSIQEADQLAVISRIKTVCGHQDDFLGTADPKQDGVYVTMGAYSLTKIFPTLSVLSRLEHLAMTADQHLEACRKGFDGSRTEIAIPTNKLSRSSTKQSEKHIKITLHKDLEDFGKLIEEVVDLLPYRLGYVSGREMSKALLTVKKALTRNERIGALRDLFPFISQLCYCILHDKWDTIDKVDLNTRQAIISSASQLTIHLWRAIRNRIESRVESLDPSFPGTLDSGTSKLMNGYSVAAWLCWGIFNAVDSDSCCAKDSFAACVAAGYSGRIQTQEAFADLRKNVENPTLDSKVKSIKTLGSGEQENWHSRLLLLDISGHVIFRPEVAFLHCVHEMAEFSDWWSLQHTGWLRYYINKFQFHFFLDTLYIEVKKNISNSVSKEDFKTRIMTLILVNRSRTPLVSTKVKEIFRRKFITVEDPTWLSLTFFRELTELNHSDQELLKNLGGDIDSEFVRFVCDAAKRILYFEITHENTSADGFNLFQKRDLFREMVADYSMFLVLYKYRSMTKDTGGEVNVFEVDYNYGCIIDQISSWMPSKSRGESKGSGSGSQEESRSQFVRFNDIFWRWILQRFVVQMIPLVEIEISGVAGMIIKFKTPDLSKVWSQWKDDTIAAISRYFCLFERGNPISPGGFKDVKSHLENIFQDLEKAAIVGIKADSLCWSLAKLAKIQRSDLISEVFLRSTPANSIFREFDDVWNNAVTYCASIVDSLDFDAKDCDQTVATASQIELCSSLALETQRLSFAWILWAKSQKLCFDRCFVVEEKNDEEKNDTGFERK
ncbi:MAG: hypothetical protein LW850_15660 [Planctomycetaceae bacterium]|jgi:hypothetical protein|nr:hypothetical protein [Planctomycetaceae bacterium]